MEVGLFRRGLRRRCGPLCYGLLDLEAELLKVGSTLARAYGTPDLGNKTDPVDELVYIILSRRTREGAYQDAFEALKRAANVNMTFVPYPGAAPAVNALLGEHVTSVFITYGAVAEQLQAGKLRALATSARTRIELLPDVPTVAEFGYKDFELDFWFGLFAPAKTPKDTVSQLASWFTAALQVPEVKSKLVAQGVYPVATCGGDDRSTQRAGDLHGVRNDAHGRAKR